jgi:uncharacterized protein (TIGR03437 family)
MHMRNNKQLALLFLILAHALRAQGVPTGTVGWYNGNCQSGIPGQSAWYSSLQQFGRTYDDFVVPAGGWMIAGVFAHSAMSIAGVTEAVWEIRSGVSVGNGGIVVASGRGAATQALMFTYPDGEKVYRVQVDGLRIQLAAGTYWLSVSPIAEPTQSYVCATVGAAASGTPAGNNGKAFYYAVGTAANVNFQALQNTGQLGTSGDFSQGVLLDTGPAPAAPSITTVINAASWQSGPVAPGEIVTIAGSGFGGSATSSLLLDHDGKVSATLNAVQVLFNGIAAPELFVSSGQINVVVPYEAADAANLSVQVKSGGATSNPFSLTPAASAPGLFTANGSGTGPAAVLNQDNSYNGPSHPAPKGSYIAVFVTGEGLTSPATTGSLTTVAKTGPLTPQPLLPVSVQIGGKSAIVAYYGEAPGLVAGVMQINVQIPSDIASGDAALAVSVGGKPSQSGVTISVQ